MPPPSKLALRDGSSETLAPPVAGIDSGVRRNDVVGGDRECRGRSATSANELAPRVLPRRVGEVAVSGRTHGAAHERNALGDLHDRVLAGHLGAQVAEHPLAYLVVEHRRRGQYQRWAATCRRPTAGLVLAGMM